MKTTKTLAIVGLALSTTLVQAEEKNPLDDMRTLDLCVNYSTLKTDAEKKATIKELDRRAQLSVKDHDNLDKNLVEPTNTMCGMYMILGKPLQERSRQLRPMVFKTVHVYPEHYYVTQMGMIVEKYQREEDTMPKLQSETPAVQQPPTLYNSPGGSTNHHQMK